ncbi:LPXTG cell wall anchor domain-containing protein [Streptococcus ruminantium]|uniref:LPXTG cell wall anchor domain-containing protein n=1 Tax=Streptococcus ruminantium TaxID=1917441 RepID=UPI00280C8775|nr:LPXTG cell wall anchor domain-containing protein [Streptococcus ruminantium]MDQ8821098.1 LPXTG cell wall anchor domain-containing protein [Streptococcus ruminantium]MDQ8836464.1 LPXTG cell wall anchor domain-containing protein [Streptococcus ruminantium]
MDKLKKKQCYSLRKTQMGVGSVLLATVLLTAGATRADSVVGQGDGLGLGGGAYIYGNGEHSEVEEPGVHVPEKGNEPKEKLPETPKPQPQSSPSGHSNSGLSSNAQTSTYKLYSQIDGQDPKEVDEGKITTKEQLEEAEKKEKEAKKNAGYPYVDRFNRDGGSRVLLIFYKHKSYIITKSGEGETATQGTSTFYKDNTELEKEIERLKKVLADTYDVKREDGEKDEDGVKVKTVTLTLTKRGLKPQVTPQPEKPSTPEVAPKPGDKPSVPSKPEVAPKPDAKPSVPSIPEMVPEPEKLEMDKSMKVVPGKPEKATPEAQVPEAQVPQVQVPQPQTPQLPSPKEEVAKAQQQPRAIQSSAPAKSGGKQLPNTGEAASILTLVGSGTLGLLGLAFTKKRKTK